METIKTRHQRQEEEWPNHPGATLAPWARLKLADKEIADLRAALAKQAEAAPVVAVTDSELIGLAAESGVFGTIPQVLAYGRAAIAQRAASVEAKPVAYADPNALATFEYERKQSKKNGPHARKWMWANPADKLVPLFSAAPPAQPDSGRDGLIAQVTEMKWRAIEAHRQCYRDMRANPAVATLQDNGALHCAIHAIVGVETPLCSSVPPDSGRDAARYRWLRDQDCIEQLGRFTPYVVQGQTMKMLEGDEVDAAVDAAMAAQQGETGGDHG